jgi:hypothetical protein
MELIKEIQLTTKNAKTTKGLEEFGTKLEEALDKLQNTAMELGKNAMSAKFKVAFAHSVPFLMVMGDVILAWFLLWRAVVASKALEARTKKKDVAYYQGQIKNVQFFLQNIIPITLGKMEAITFGSDAAIEIENESFGEK